MASPYAIYDLLEDHAASAAAVREVLLGLVWTYCEAEAMGLAMSPGLASRTLPFAGTLRGKPLAELAGWVREFEPFRAAIGMAAVNAAINGRQLLPEGVTLAPGESGNLAVFEHFLPLIQGKKTVVIGRYPGLDRFIEIRNLDLTVLERQPGPGDITDAAAEYLLPEAEWVFLTASAIPNKTFPRLAELSREATTVLMGPTTPWLPDLHHFGIDYLAGVEIADPAVVRNVIAEGGGVRLFDAAVRYRVAPLGSEAAIAWSKALIARTASEKAALTGAMAAWYATGATARFPRYAELEAANRKLSRLDACYQKLWSATHPIV